jgi:hypothetical protein
VDETVAMAVAVGIAVCVAAALVEWGVASEADEVSGTVVDVATDWKAGDTLDAVPKVTLGADTVARAVRLASSWVLVVADRSACVACTSLGRSNHNPRTATIVISTTAISAQRPWVPLFGRVRPIAGEGTPGGLVGGYQRPSDANQYPDASPCRCSDPALAVSMVPSLIASLRPGRGRGAGIPSFVPP